MLLRICGFAFLLLALAVVVGATAGQDKKETGKDVKEIVGKVKEVNADKKFFIITIDEKSDRTFEVNKDTKFTGPRGGDREDGLKDDCMSKGYEVRVVPAADEKIAKEVKLPLRKKDDEKKKGKKGTDK